MIENTTSSYVINSYESSFNLARKRCKAHLVTLWVYKNSDVCIITLEYWDNVTIHIKLNMVPLYTIKRFQIIRIPETMFHVVPKLLFSFDV